MAQQLADAAHDSEGWVRGHRRGGASPTDFAFTLTGTRAEAMKTRAVHTRNLIKDFILRLA
jgi:hypothetical protein